MKENVNLTCAQAKEIDLVIYLSSLGFEPERIRANQFWYFSPFRNERTPSFKINRILNRWYDFGDGVGGSIIDFGIRYFSCSIPELLESILAGNHIPRKGFTIAEQKAAKGPNLIVNKIQSLGSISLVNYLNTRRISFELASQYLKEVYYTNSGRQFYGLGFENDLGGWEIRSSWFKGSAAPKFVTHLNSGSGTIRVFEGFMDFLSFLQLRDGSNKFKSSDYLIINSVAMSSKAIPILKSYSSVDLYLDNNSAGEKATQLIKSDVIQSQDRRFEFKGFSDLNNYLCHKHKSNVQPP
ncbi:toprim domain-containing protein [Sphingobacterium siyangense]|uniref:toprim domain-containing protein n=1 Tax=Sphingobacterium siyangense TaxID=459529 RepID=UPI002FDAE2F3